MSAAYPKSRLPGPAVRAFDLELGMEGQQTIRVSFETETRRQAPHPAIIARCRDPKDPQGQ